jgi:hypothetical protein
MSTGKILTAVLWLIGAAATAAVSIAWMLAAEGGMVNAFALVSHVERGAGGGVRASPEGIRALPAVPPRIEAIGG